MSDLFFFLIGRVLLLLAPQGRFPIWNRCALKIIGVTLGVGVVIYSSISIVRKINLSVGDYTFIGSYSVFTGGSGSSISIGSYCDISDHVHFVTGTHDIDTFGNRSAGAGCAKDIIVGDGVWIGYGALILPGVEIGNKAIIAAGTVVHKDVAARTLVAGSPMKTIRNL
jgi:maltose O-acetyltransferase